MAERADGKVTILLCTRNREMSLRKTLHSLSQVVIPAAWACELVVVDNGSTDDTRNAVESHRCLGMQVHYAFDGHPGQTHARNTGLAAGTGDVFLLTDDDVRVPRSWVHDMCRPILTNAADVVAGCVDLSDALKSACMRHPLLRPLLACYELVNADDAWDLVTGASMAFSRRVLEAVPGFDEQLGPGRLGFHDDVLFRERLRAAGFRCVVAPPEATVVHEFDPSRLRRASQRRQARAMGRSVAHYDYHWRHTEVRWARIKLLRSFLGLWWVRMRHPAALFDKAAMSGAERHQLTRVAYWRQLLAERGTPRKYGRDAATGEAG